jgi:hypothetical protein
VVVGREGARPESDLADLVARREAAAAETIHHEGGAARASQRLKRLGKLVGIVRQLGDLGRFEGRAHGVAPSIVGGGRVAHDDLLHDTGNLQCDRLVHGAAAQRQGSLEGLEAGKLDVNLRIPRRQRRGDRQAPLIGRKSNGITRRRRHDDGRLRNAGTGFVDDDQAQLRLVGVLSPERRGQEECNESENDPCHLVKVFALRFGLIR